MLDLDAFKTAVYLKYFVLYHIFIIVALAVERQAEGVSHSASAFYSWAFIHSVANAFQNKGANSKKVACSPIFQLRMPFKTKAQTALCFFEKGTAWVVNAFKNKGTNSQSG